MLVMAFERFNRAATSRKEQMLKFTISDFWFIVILGIRTLWHWCESRTQAMYVGSAVCIFIFVRLFLASNDHRLICRSLIMFISLSLSRDLVTTQDLPYRLDNIRIKNGCVCGIKP